VEDAESLAGLAQAGSSGTLRINSSVAFGRRVLIPLVLRYMAEHPGLQIDLGFDDQYVNLVEQGVDVAIRIGRLADSSLGARHLGINPWVLTAAPAYLATHGQPRTPAELSAHACLIYSSVQGDARWLLHGPGGEDLSIPVRGPLRSNNLSAVLAACRAGMGLAMLPWYVARESVAEGHLLPLLEDHALPVQEMHAVFPSPKLVPAKVTGFIAWLQLQLDGAWWMRVLMGPALQASSSARHQPQDRFRSSSSASAIITGAKNARRQTSRSPHAPHSSRPRRRRPVAGADAALLPGP
jgi:DNA-binding transcriptional LysR family regulator